MQGFIFFSLSPNNDNKFIVQNYGGWLQLIKNGGTLMVFPHVDLVPQNSRYIGFIIVDYIFLYTWLAVVVSSTLILGPLLNYSTTNLNVINAEIILIL